MSDTTEKKVPKSLRAMKYNWKLRFNNHQGTEKEGSIKFNYKVTVMTHGLVLHQG